MRNRPMFTRMLMMFFVFALAVGGGLIGCEVNGDHKILGSLTGHYEGTFTQQDGTTGTLVLNVVEGPASDPTPEGVGLSIAVNAFIGRLSDESATSFATFEGIISGDHRELLSVTVVFDENTFCNLRGDFLLRSNAGHITGQLNPEVVENCIDSLRGGTLFVTLDRTSTTPVFEDVIVLVPAP